MNESTCKVDGCGKRAHARDLCPMHYRRQRTHGSPGDAEPSRRRNSGSCSLEYCDQPMRKAGWCASHYAQWYRYGEVRPFAYKWADEKRCLVCGATEWQGKRRKVCSAACQQMLHRMSGDDPSVRTMRPPSHQVTCQRCGTLVDLNERGKAGRRRRSDTLHCTPCRRARYTRHGISVSVLYERDGGQCLICSEEIDMTLKAPHLFRASVDHIVPYALGGPHTLANVQLAHLWCNQVKHVREGFTI